MPSNALTTKKTKKTYADIEVVREPDGETFLAKIFDDPKPFLFSTDVNGYLQLGAYSGEPGAFNEFMLSLLEVEVDDDADQDVIDQARFETKKRFTDLLKAQKGLTIQRLVKFSVDITEIAGNDQPT